MSVYLNSSNTLGTNFSLTSLMKRNSYFLQFIPMVILTAAIFYSAVRTTEAKSCVKCGDNLVPYPLSTGPDCGDQSYKIRCINASTLWFSGMNGTSYLITSIDPMNQRLIILPPGLASKGCVSADFPTEGLSLDPNLPFNITASNSLIYYNCSDEIYQFNLNCSPTSICHQYMRDDASVTIACAPSSSFTNVSQSQICCDSKTGGSSTAYWIRVHKDKCAAYFSFVNLDESLPTNKWPAGLELEWQLPKEPICQTGPSPCSNFANTACVSDPAGGGGVKRCICNSGYQWDAINGICQSECDHGKHCKPRKKTAIFGGMAACAFVFLFGGLITGWVYVKRKHSKRKRNGAQLSLRHGNIVIANGIGKSARIFTGREIARATNNFAKDKLLGSGGFGEVFKAVFDDGSVTAVKRAKHGSTKGLDQLLNEVRILCQVNHRSLVRILGFCLELEQPLLVYEFVPNGTLFDHLHCSKSGKWTPLRWQDRLMVAHQTAEGLSYLHTSAVPNIYHRDIKSSNILLDEKLNAKVTDFGLSRLAVNEASHVTTSAQGTLGYLDPEYYMNFQLTDKSDVYSFGVVLLELLTSKKAIDFNRDEDDVNLAVHIKKALREERLMDVIDPTLKDGANNVELDTMKALGSLAAACLDEKRNNRPSMKEVADEIEYIISILSDSMLKLGLS